jgi:hypothetical protein
MHPQNSRLRQTESTRRLWTQPTITTIPLAFASGSVAGSLCDKHGSLSHGGASC